MPPTAPPPAVCSAPSPRALDRLRLAYLAPLGLVALVASMAPAAQAGDLTRFAELPNAPAKMRILRPGGPIKVNGREQRNPGAPANVRMLGRVVNESVSEGAIGPSTATTWSWCSRTTASTR